ncbi:MAG: hypothetical protein AAF657_09305 [Acidobacteriota bacterium]
MAELNEQAPGFLELLTTLDRATPPIPLLGTANGGLLNNLPVESSNLPLLDLELPTTDYASRLESAISAASVGKHKYCRQGVDYLLPAVLCRRSVSMELLSTGGLEVSVEVVGGDIWNAYAGVLEAVPALETILFQTISRVEIRMLQMIPGERQMGHSGLEALGPATRLLKSRRVQDSQRFGTREIDISGVAAEMRAMNSQQVELAGTPESPNDRFEHLLATGIEASLARDYPRAGRAFEEALTLKPGDARVRHNLERIRQYL